MKDIILMGERYEYNLKTKKRKNYFHKNWERICYRSYSTFKN